MARGFFAELNYRSTRGTLVVLATLLVSGLLTALPGASAAPPASYKVIDVAHLPVGALPHLPYVDWPARRIVDGSRRVSISGIQGRVISLDKVDGGYVLGRELPVGNDLVFVTNTGARRVLVSRWLPPRRGDMQIAVAVSGHGDKVMVNTADFSGGYPDYTDTRVVSVMGGKLLHRRVLGGVFGPQLMGYGVDRALLGSDGNIVWWNPAANTLATVYADASAEAADLNAWQMAVRPQASGYALQNIGPATSPNWTIEPEDTRIGPWSLNGAYVAGSGEVNEGDEAQTYHVHRTSDGGSVWGIQVQAPPQMTWETNSTLLLRTHIWDTLRYQLIRCTLSGSCSKVGPSTTDRRGSIIPASRRNS
jgi:hypothetical protein